MPRSALALALVVAATLVGACGSDSSNQNADTTTNATASTNDDTGGSTPAEGRAAAGNGVRLVKVGDFEAPLYVTAPPGDRRRVFVVEQAGRIVVVRGGTPVAQPFLDIRSKVTAGGEQGLLSMAFAPDYAQSGLFYVYYTEKSGTESIWEYHRASDDRADAGSARLVLRMDDPEPNHNGGLMVFGPDKLMYVGTGDGGGGNDQHGARGNAQSLSSPLGKILRIDPRRSGGRAYTIPSSNPFVGRAGARGEINPIGVGYPWGVSLDRANGGGL
jgi:glucose/arabinose dehydrogenase